MVSTRAQKKKKKKKERRKNWPFARLQRRRKKEKKIDPSVGRSVVVYAGLISRSKTQKERT
jgi:hypothetical protein